jgi:hypothetical protein
MRKLRQTLVVGLGLVALAVPAPAALADPPATPPRADAYVEVWCRAPDGTVAAYERVDAQSVDQGNKDVQVEHYGLHHEGWFCQIGPFV